METPSYWQDYGVAELQGWQVLQVESDNREGELIALQEEVYGIDASNAVFHEDGVVDAF